MAELLQRLRERGWRITPQRRAVAQALSGEHVHLTAEQIFEGARTIVPEISRATVYNTLRELVEMKEALEVASGAGPTRYDPNVERAHHHLTCLSCGELLDVYTLGEEALRLEDAHGYAVLGASITFHGYCEKCRSRMTDPSPP
jgi:Fe2+ or Zn2+ uptake regulation protein